MDTSERTEGPAQKGAGSNEFFYLAGQGNKQDVDLHADMLDNRAADKKWRLRAKQRNLDNGMSLEDADALFD